MLVNSGQHWPRLVEAFKDVKAITVAAGSDFVVALSEQWVLYTWGRGDSGQLGHGDLRHRSVPTICTAIQRKGRMVACGNQHTLILTENGDVHGMGLNDNGQLGIGTTEKYVKTPCHINGLRGKAVRQLAAGQSHSAALTNVGEVYTWGSNEHGQLGIGVNVSYEMVPTRVAELQGVNITNIACGDNHTMALSDTGEVYAWGRGTYGALGLTSELNRFVPEPIKVLRRRGVRDIACGGDHTVAVTYAGEIYIWGRNMFSQLGLGTSVDQISAPILLQGLPPNTDVRQIACGAMHTMLLMERGEIYSWGRCDNGQLGVGNVSKQRTPRLVKALCDKNIKVISCGANHTVAVAGGTGQLYAMGKDTYGQQGIGNELLIRVREFELAKAPAGETQAHAPTSAISSLIMEESWKSRASRSSNRSPLGKLPLSRQSPPPLA